MGLFSKPKIPGIDVGALMRIADQTANTQRDILGRRKAALEPLTQRFQTGREALSARIVPESEQLLERFGRDVQGLGTQERAAQETATIGQRERSFRDVPEIQRAIRESLGGSGLLKSGAATTALSRPIIDAARSSRDFSTDLETERLNREAGRAEGLATTGFNTRSTALNKRLGIDENTLNTLTELGRGDLIQEYQDLAGIEADRGASVLGIEQARQANEIARAQANAARKANITSGLLQVGGAGLGFLAGGPTGAAIGGQIGGTAGQFASGSPVSFDPTLLYALNQRTPTRRTAVVNSLGGEIPVRPYR